MANDGTNGVNLQRGPKERDLAAKDRRQGVEVMVDVEDVEVTGEVAAELMEEMKENDGIGTSGNGDTDGLGGRGEELVVFKKGGGCGEEVRGGQ